VAQLQAHNGHGKPTRVLLVEHDPRTAMMLGEMLRAAWTRGLVVSHAEQLADATQELLDHGATCVLLDLPREPPAVEAVTQLAAASPDTPIIVLSDSAGEELGVAAVRAGAQDYLLKSELNASVLGRSMRFAIERKRAETALTIQALHDPLTALPNRALFVDRVRVALDRSRRTGSAVAVLFLDVDGFKEINDSLGHSAGDRLLTILADRFRGLLRPMDTVARFGGDEFTFLFAGLDAETEAALVAQRISRSAGLPLRLADVQRSVSVSIGVAIVTDPEMPIDDLIQHADTAMYRAKERGGARFEIFDAVTGLASPRAELETALGHAVARSELRVHYQPRVSLNAETGLVGFEALVRWEHPELGLMGPVDFIPIAEETGLIVPIGDWVLEQALHQVGRWRQSRPGVTISVNLSGRQLIDPGFVRRLRTAMSEGGHEPSVLCLEVSEHALAVAPELATRALAALNEMGVKLAIDDFGTSDSTARALSELPMDILKIDRTLVSRLGDGNGALADVGAAVKFGHTLGLSVVAEGVETDAQLAQLRDLGCDGAQGYLFSQPMPEEGVFSMLGSR
jgi:diguanylate cyclase (GGDEF)-like protein